MSKLFTPRADEVLRLVVFVVVALVILVMAGVAYYATPAYTRVGYEPIQPVRFSHRLHAGELGMDCTFCHNHVQEAPHANVPSLQTCMNCHGASWGNIRASSAALGPLREAWESGRGLPWVQVHRLPGYAYFDHAVHVQRGVGCVACHGRVDEMDVVRHVEPLSMSWCLDCHRDPWSRLGPADLVTDLAFSPEEDWDETRHGDREAFLHRLVHDARIAPPETCSGCHR